MSVEQHAEAAATWIGETPTATLGTIEHIIAKHMQSAIDEATAPNEHAEVGALLAKCGYFEAGRDGSLWWAWVRLPGKCQAFRSQGPTQLAAIRAAVEAAEKGVRE